MVNIIVSEDSGIEAVVGPAPAPVAVFDNFLPADLAQAMRADIEAHFSAPFAHRPETHQLWNYWYVPGRFTYLRTKSDNIIRRDHVAEFLGILLNWSVETLGLVGMDTPYLSMYLPGCKQGWHNDAGNGRFAFVYSLTKNDRRTTGGETLVMREGDAIRRFLTPRPSSHQDFYQTIAPAFNRLVIFDDRIPHAVERVDGVMDPLEARFVVHGHLTEGSAVVTGGLPIGLVEEVMEAAVRDFAAEFATRLGLYRGPLSIRLTVGPDGEVSGCDVLIDRVLHPNSGDTGWGPLREALFERLEALRFPVAAHDTVVILPVMFGARPRYPE